MPGDGKRARSSNVDLRPVRYQSVTVRGDSYDDRWLVVGGTVASPEGKWSFADPCLLTDEARHTWFIEPVVAFSLAHRIEGGTAVIRVHLSLEAPPPWQQSDDGAGIYQYVVEVRWAAAALLRAADEWDLSLASLPPR
ncbi:hypothetical protein PL81_41125 [Streptomyces sp. RSD-27]|nr:hypothetical protein PL81_41125 [Streptomyces sp. RSD-27]